jgi:hypothetical protein
VCALCYRCCCGRRSAELWDGQCWTLLPSMSMQRDRCGACALQDGRVAVLGGSGK